MDPETFEDNVRFLNASVDEIGEYTNTTHLLTEIYLLFIWLTSIISNIIIIYIIMKFKKMKNRNNMYILNWCLSNMLYLLFSTLTYRLFDFFEGEKMNATVSCILLEFDVVFLFVTDVFVMLLTIDWFVVTYTVAWSIKYRSSFKTIIITTWLLIICFIASISLTCICGQYKLALSYYALFISYCLLFIITILVHVLKYIKSKQTSTNLFKSTLPLKLTTAYVLCWGLGWSCVLAEVFNFFHLNYFVAGVFVSFGYGNAIITLFLLIFLDKHFCHCLLISFGCRKPYEESEFDTDNHVIDSNAIQVTSLISDEA